MQQEGCYQCDTCGDEYYFSDAYDEYHSQLSGETYYIIHGWYGNYDGQDMCECCWDSY